MKLLYIAYSCDPYSGSEDKIGWNVPLESAKTNEVYVITKVEHRENIRKYMLGNNVKNIRVYYIDIPYIYKKLFKGFLYSGRLNTWNRKAFPLAKKICKKEKIDLIHQITPIEFRSIGNYGHIKNTKFVCGPLGGGESLPLALKSYAKKHKVVELIRNMMNQLSRLSYQVTNKEKYCDYMLFANEETRRFLLGNTRKKGNNVVMTEIAISEKDILEDSIDMKNINRKCVFLVAGRLIYRKGHELLLDALEDIPDGYDFECRIVGDGPEYNRILERCQGRLKNKVILVGNVGFNQMIDEYKKANVLVMPSLRETTGSVILEAMSKGIPVITINKFGAVNIVDNETGWLYDGKSKEEYIFNLKNCLMNCIVNSEEVIHKGQNAKKKIQNYTWKKKCRRYFELYQNIYK